MLKFCIREDYYESEGVYVGPIDCLCYEGIVKVWVLYYSDGSTETLTMRERVE